MTAAEFADLLGARRVGSGRWMAKCPAHSDREASLSIRAGRDGRVLVHCFAACRKEDVLKELKLGWGDICGEKMTPAQTRQAAAERQEREQRQQERRVTERVAFDRIRKLHAIDHAQLDILLLKEDGTAARPWLTIVIDDYSRAIAGYPSAR